MSNRSGSQNRLRRYLVGVRLSPAEMELLIAAARQSGRSLSGELRQTFLAADSSPPILPEECICGEINARHCPVHNDAAADASTDPHTRCNGSGTEPSPSLVLQSAIWTWPGRDDCECPQHPVPHFHAAYRIVYPVAEKALDAAYEIVRNLGQGNGRAEVITP